MPLDSGRVLLGGWKEIAAVLGVTARTAARYGDRYRLPIFRIGTRVFVYEDTLRDWLERFRVSREA